MIVGTGVDIVEVRRIRRSLGRFGERFVNRVLCPGERRDLKGDRLVAYVARQFAAKEAVSKALGTGMKRGVRFSNIEVTRESSGAPKVELSGEARQRAEELGITAIHISMSDERDYAIAYVLATSDG